MRQFKNILAFELRNYFANKVFVGVTILIVVALAAVMFFPRLTNAVSPGTPEPEPGPGVVDPDPTETPDDGWSGGPVMLIAGGDETVRAAFAASFWGYDVRLTDGDVAERIRSGEAECGFVLDGLTSYVYYVDNLSMYDSNAYTASEILTELYRLSALAQAGVPADTAEEILSVYITGSTESLGVDQARNFLYTYVMIFALYMVILLYGQMVASGVATEKSSRAMELLVTSASPTSMMFGKVIAACLAGFAQLAVIFGAAIAFFDLNRVYWDAGGVIASIFDMPPELLAYMLVFFVLGFFIYAFMYGAVGSVVSKLEDLNTAVMPVMFLFIAMFFIVMFSLASGNVDTALMRVCSFIPFTSPMAMFTRVAMSAVPFYEIAVSVLLLIACVFGVGVAAAKIYRVGVLLYGTKPTPGEIVKAVRQA